MINTLWCLMSSNEIQREEKRVTGMELCTGTFTSPGTGAVCIAMAFRKRVDGLGPWRLGLLYSFLIGSLPCTM